MPGGRPRVFDSADEMQAAIDGYFSLLKETKGKSTVTGLALALGFESRQSIYDYKESGEFSYIIKRALLQVENGYEERLSENNVTGAIFALKNMGWKDKTEQDIKYPDGVVIKHKRQDGNDPLDDV